MKQEFVAAKQSWRRIKAKSACAAESKGSTFWSETPVDDVEPVEAIQKKAS
jgi:hypothetical protein